MRFLCGGESDVAHRGAARPALLLLFLVCLAGPAPAQEPEAAGSDVALRGVVIPTGFQGGKYLAMIQVAVDGSPLPNATWDLGVSFTPNGGTPERSSGHVTAEEPGRPVVFETLIEFEPGHFVLELEARETSAGQGQERQLDARWPDPDDSPATISPIVVLQPVQGTFVRGESAARAQGALAIGGDTPLGIHLPTAVVTVVCRGADTPGTVRVERKLEGSSAVEFQTIELAPGNEPCAQVRDMFRPGTLGRGFFRYRVTLFDEGREIATKAYDFAAGTGGEESRPGS